MLTKIAPQEGPQTTFMAAPFMERFLGGGRGGGKTFGVCIDWIRHADQYRENARGLILRESFPALEDFLENKAKNLFPPLGWVYEVGKKRWVHPNGAVLRLGFIDKVGDEDQYQGAEYTWLCFEELTNWSEKQKVQLDKLRACMRSAAGVPIKILATGNPGGVGHTWVKERYIDPAPPLTPFLNPETNTEMVYIPSVFENNKLLAENDPDYLNRIIGPPHLKRAWRLGDWNVSPAGNVILTEWWQYYDWNPDHAIYGEMAIGEVPKMLGRIQAWDTAQEIKKKNDYSACVTAAYTRTDVYILDAWRGKVNFPALCEKAEDLAEKWRPGIILIEGKASGKSMRQALKQDTLLPIKEVSAQDDKMGRVSGVTGLMEAGRVWLPKRAGWLEDFTHECSVFPEGGNDDMVDALAHLLKKVSYTTRALQKLQDKKTKRAPASIYGR